MWDFTSVHSIITLTITIARLMSFALSLACMSSGKVNKIWEELEGYRKKLARAEAIFEASKTTANQKELDLLTRLASLVLLITLREKQQNAAVVFFNNRVTAASAAQSLHAQMVDHWAVIDASERRQILWPNLKIKFFERQVRQYVPVVNIKALRTVLEAYLPQLALIIFLALLPKLLFFLSKLEGIPTQSHAVTAASGKYYYFTELNVFIGVTLSGTLFRTLKTIEKNLNQVVSMLTASLPGNATFFLNYVALKFFVGYGLELSRVVPLIIFHIKKKFLCKTEAEVKEDWLPGDLSYGTKFLALKVYVPSYESYRRMWPHIHNRILASLILYQVTMVGYFIVQKFYYTPLLFPLPILSLLYGFVSAKKFYRAFRLPALEIAAYELKGVPNMELIFRSFIPPSLSNEKIDDNQFEDALSQVSRSTSFF
ncbi:hypothetical protein L6164_037211 [Bauhinia variegata]|uniref:Uncharacterized protein n=1 Tax=Bauhinia variegata TaxID=167791 RepID=A0ACB9KJJ7_BAUVA|nr:hypothetical protein L6164_037211 [Bauhinia variegata]